MHVYDYVTGKPPQSLSANVDKSMFESDTPCRRSRHNVSDVVTQSTGSNLFNVLFRWIIHVVYIFVINL